jgi:hypothetical protein
MGGREDGGGVGVEGMEMLMPKPQCLIQHVRAWAIKR